MYPLRYATIKITFGFSFLQNNFHIPQSHILQACLKSSTARVFRCDIQLAVLMTLMRRTLQVIPLCTILKSGSSLLHVDLLMLGFKTTPHSRLVVSLKKYLHHVSTVCHDDHCVDSMLYFGSLCTPLMHRVCVLSDTPADSKLCLSL